MPGLRVLVVDVSWCVEACSTVVYMPPQLHASAVNIQLCKVHRVIRYRGCLEWLQSTPLMMQCDALNESTHLLA